MWFVNVVHKAYFLHRRKQMRFRHMSVLTAVTLVGVLLAFRPAATEFGKITLPLGIVEVQSAGGADWARAKVRQPVFA